MTSPAPEPARRRIAVLPEHLANKIAAGEVVGRPESVVKELLENSLDAGARDIHVAVKNGGKTLIQIIDDGCGMDETDAKASFLRHATSKIASYSDLEEVLTYGFRGEALASIASVAQVTMTTRREDEDAAVVAKIEGGGETRVSHTARERGTTISVQNLFYNVPARRKFLKSDSTEFRHVYDAVQRAALSRPDISFTFRSDDETIFLLPAGTLEQRLTDLFGERQVASLLPITENTEHVRVSGYIGKPSFGLKTRQHQYIFLNGRFIQNRNITHAVYSAYEHTLLKGTFPFFLLYLEIDPHRVDVNVHPSKMEAKFDDDQGMYRILSSVVRRSLGTPDAVVGLHISAPASSGGGGSYDAGLRFTPAQHVWPSQNSPGFRVDTSTGEILPDPSAGGRTIASELLRSPELPVSSQSPSAGDALRRSQEFVPGVVWQLHNKYILAQIENGVMIVDQHVAHERILYEAALARFESGMRQSQQLLFPVTVQLTPQDYALLEELYEHFQGIGFDVKLFGKNTCVLDGVPPDVKGGSEEHLLQEMLDQYNEYQQHGPSDARDSVAKSYSCRSAIKAGDPLSVPEMRELISQLFATKMPFVCPHGRPIVLRIAIDEFDRRLGRT